MWEENIGVGRVNVLMSNLVKHSTNCKHLHQSFRTGAVIREGMEEAFNLMYFPFHHWPNAHIPT